MKKILPLLKTHFLYYFPFKHYRSISYEKAVQFLHQLRPYQPEYPNICFPPAEQDLSIILPVYNAEKHIVHCLKSITGQKTTCKIELIVVDDGSTDRSAELIKKENIPGIQFFQTSNHGVGQARNFALNRARGKYVMFMDADDELRPGAIELLMSEALREDACITIGNFYYIYENGRPSRMEPNKTSLRVININSNRGDIYHLNAYPWGKVYKRELFQDAGFPNLTFEDTLIWLTTYHRAHKITVLPDAVYNYTIHKNSESGRISAGSVRGIDTFYIIPYLIELNKRLGIPLDETLYRQVLFQFGKIMYHRNNKAEDELLSVLLVAAKKTLIELEAHCPRQLTRLERYIKKAILDVNLNLYKHAVWFL